jgi:hypothetical protein
MATAGPSACPSGAHRRAIACRPPSALSSVQHKMKRPPSSPTRAAPDEGACGASDGPLVPGGVRRGAACVPTFVSTCAHDREHVRGRS